MRGARTAGSGTETRNIWTLAGFSTITNLADGVTKVLLPLMATTLTRSPIQVSLVGLSLTLPWLLTALHVGSLVDRVERRSLLVVANVLRAVAIGALLVAQLGSVVSLPLLYVTGAVLGFAEVVALTASAAIVPQAVSKQGRDRVNSWLAATETVCNEFCGPFLGGVLVSAGMLFALGATGAAFAVATLAPMLLVGHFRAERSTGSRGSAPARGSAAGREITEGLRLLWVHPLLRTMALTLTALCLAWGAWLAIIPLYAVEEAGLGPRGYGLVLSALGLGGLAGAALTRPLNRLLGRRRVMLLDLVGTVVMVGVPVFSAHVALLAVSAFAGGLGGTLWTVNSRTLNQGLVPAAVMGRFHAAWRLVSWGALPVGALIVGLLAEHVGLRAAFVPFAVLAAVMSIPFLRHITPAAIASAELADADATFR